MKTQMQAIDALRLLINPGSSKIRLQFTIPRDFGSAPRWMPW